MKSVCNSLGVVKVVLGDRFIHLHYLQFDLKVLPGACVEMFKLKLCERRKIG